MLQCPGRLLGATRRGYRCVARIVADQLRIIGKCFFKGAVNTEAVDHPGTLPIDVFVGHDIGGGAVPAAARLDTEQIMAVAPTGRGDLVTPPARFQRRLGQNQFGRHSGLAAGSLGRCAKTIQEVLHMLTLASSLSRCCRLLSAYSTLARPTETGRSSTRQ